MPNKSGVDSMLFLKFLSDNTTKQVSNYQKAACQAPESEQITKQLISN